MGNYTFGNATDLQSDESLEVGGIDLDFGSGRFITIARAGGSNRKYRTVLSELYKPNKTAMDFGTMEDSVAEKLMKEVFAKAIVLDWRGWKDQDGNEIPFSVEAALDLFDALPEVYSVIRDEADKFSNFSRKEVEESGN